LLRRYANNQPAGEDHLRFALACKLRDLGLTEEEARACMHWWNEQECEFPRNPAEIDKAVTNAYRYARDEAPGSAAAPAAKEVFHDLIEPPPPEPTTPAEAASRLLQRSGLQLTVLPLGEALNEPEPEWFVRNALPAKGLCVLYGPPKRGKSSAAVDLALATASGRPWLGLWPILLPGPVIYIALEGYPDLIGRARSWQEAHGAVPDGSFHVVRGHLPIGDEVAVCALVEALRLVCAHPSLIVVDTHARAMLASGLEENDAVAQGQAAAAMERIGEAFGCTVVAVAHTGKDVARGIRGSNALLGAAEAALSADIQEGTLILRVEEIRRGKPGLEMRARVIAGPEEYPVWGGIEDPLVADRPDPSRKAALRARAFLAAMCRAATSGLDAEIISRPEFIRRVHAHLPEYAGWTYERTRREVERALDSNAVLRAKLLASHGRIAIMPRSERSALFAEARLSEQEETPSDG
jgi:hypothetical protein